MLSTGTLRQRAQQNVRYVYLEMLEAQADTQEGKLQRGDQVIVPEDKALRWVYRSRIAKPSTREKYDDFMDERGRRRGAVRPRRRMRDIPDEPEFAFVDEQSPEWGEAEANREQDSRRLTSQGGGDEHNLADDLTLMDNEEESDDSGEVTDMSPGVYDARMESGPGEGRRPRLRGRGRNKNDE